MCRSIKQLRRPERDVSEAEIQAAALQYVRKVSGFRKPARANTASFDAAVAEVAATTRRLLIQINALDGPTAPVHALDAAQSTE
ncbi:MAG TPA: DUF2277 family protein [Chloroflexota bacterium]|nr:DUF2277 family protein [Chloroflexota bacterium]